MPGIVCLADKVAYSITNRLGQVDMGYELGSMGLLEFSLSSGDDVTGITVNGGQIMNGNEAWDTDVDTTVQNIVDNINGYSGTSGYRAERAPHIGTDTIKIFEVVATETNAYDIVATVTGGGSGTELMKLKGGIDIGLTKALLATVSDKLHFANSANKATKVAGTAVLGNASTGNTNADVTEVS